MPQDFSKMIEKSARGSILLMLGQVTSTIISAFGAIFVARVLGSNSYGVLIIAVIPVNITLLLVNNGVSSALTNMIAEDRHLKKGENVNSIIYSGYAINLTVGLISTMSLYIFSDQLAFNIFNKPELSNLIKILSITPLAQAFYISSSSILVGFERLKHQNLLNIISSLLKSSIGPIFVYLGYGAMGAAIGWGTPVLLAGIIGLTLVIYNLRRIKGVGNLGYMKSIIQYSIPIFISAFLSEIFLQVLKFTLPLYVTPNEVGNYSVAFNFTILINLILSPISTAMFPLLSKLKPTDRVFQSVYSNIIKYEALAAYPLASAIIALSDRMINILYGPDYPTAISYVKILMLNYFFLAFGSTINEILLNSQKRTDINLKTTIIYLLIGIPMGFLLLPRYGILGFLAATILAPKLGLLYSIYWIRKNMDIRLEIISTLKIALSTLLGYLACKIVLNLFHRNPWIELFIGGITLATVYVTSIIATGVLNRKNIQEIIKMIDKNRLGKEQVRF